MRAVVVSCLLFVGLGCKGEPETDVVKAPEVPKVEETAGGSGVGTGVRKIGEIKKN